MTTRTSTTLRKAFKRFVELVEPIEDVRHVVAFEDDEPEIWTFITKLDDKVSFRVYEAEGQIIDSFPSLMVDFHVRFLEGETVETFIGPLPPLSFSRDVPD
jgi:hypothetical protein